MSVWLVGAGCGLPSLLTLSAAECLSRADHVVYDRLIHPDILQLAPPECHFHLVGKSARNHTMRQNEINELLASLGREGGTVVRLKGGDPFVFGRGGEEAEFLEGKGVPWRAIPGVTSAIGGAVTLGLPVTHRDLSSSMLLVTGHRRADLDADTDDDDGYWQRAANVEGTVAIYMGAVNFDAVSDRLLSCGKSPGTPVSVVKWGGWNRASRIDGTLAEIAAMSRRREISGPSIIYMGGSAGIKLSCENTPLCGMQVVICRPYPECWNTGRAVEAMGADCYGLPLLGLEEIDIGNSDKSAITSADWLIITSPRGAARIAGLIDLRHISGKVVAIGGGTSSALKSLGIVPDLVAEGDSKNLAGLLSDAVSSGESVVFARNFRGSDVPFEAVRARGASASVIPTYRMTARRVPGIEVMREQWEMCGVDAVVFGSSAMAEAYTSALGEPPKEAALVAWGTECGVTIKRIWGREAEIMPSPDMDGLMRIIPYIWRKS